MHGLLNGNSYSNAMASSAGCFMIFMDNPTVRINSDDFRVPPLDWKAPCSRRYGDVGLDMGIYLIWMNWIATNPCELIIGDGLYRGNHPKTILVQSGELCRFILFLWHAWCQTP